MFLRTGTAMEGGSELARARRALRAELRARRRGMSPDARKEAERRVAREASTHFRFHPGQRIALYSPLPEELDISPLAQLARRQGALLYLPRIVDRRHRRMRFVAARGPMRANRLGILEPAAGESISARRLDLVFVPLVGFDAAGMRLGMGAGYYDRAFAFLRLRATWRRPKLIGVAYAVQRVPLIAGAPHDVRLDAVVTEEGMLTCRSGC
ncbi:MAG: 5-formyltetrahydrofolate cyclo-ligase [Steroidobacteraceae bacterium]